MYCMKCGKEIPNDSTFCDTCGATVDVPVEARGVENATPPQSFKQPGYTVDPTITQPKKKRSKAIIILSVIAALALIGCGVLGFVVADQAGTIASQDKRIENYIDTIDERGRRLMDLQKDADFLERYVVVVTNNSGKKYHKYSCYQFQNSIWPNSKTYWIYNVEAARQDGYRPCPICCN